jgi:hypothetical protein
MIAWVGVAAGVATWPDVALGGAFVCVATIGVVVATFVVMGNPPEL